MIEALHHDCKCESRNEANVDSFGCGISCLFGRGRFDETLQAEQSQFRVPVIPTSRRVELLERSHGEAHLDVLRTYELLKSSAYWPDMETNAQKFVSSCSRCQLPKPAPKSEQGSNAAYLYFGPYRDLGDRHNGSFSLHVKWEKIYPGTQIF